MAQPGQRHFRALGRKQQRLSAQVLPAPESAESAPIPGSEEQTFVVDLGLGGACLELSAPPDPGRELLVRIELPGLWEPLELAAVVVWHGSPDKSGKALTGIRFVQPSGKSLRLLSETLATDFL